ncbi:hemicentin-1-like [Ornithodoros turicata]|uniref:hemicentin-1-like n=1 Tax=Ornithodoros turicata TaxID=34597 RepID=UPI003139B9DC
MVLLHRHASSKSVRRYAESPVLIFQLFRPAFYISVPPKIPPFSFPKNLLIGERITVTCTTSAGDRPVQFAWLKDGSAVTNSTDIRIIENRGFSTLEIEPLSERSTGNYTCTATNNAGYTSYTAPLAVHAPPTWIDEPHDVTKISGRNATLTCSAGGFPLPMVTWTKIDAGTSDRIPLKSTKDESPGMSTITIYNVGKSHQGQYICTATNGVGNDLSRTLNLRIKPPKIQAFSFPSMLTVGDSTTALCAVTAGDRPLTFTWLKDGRTLEANSNIKVSEAPVSSSMSIESLSMSHSGNYTCVVTNSVGTASNVASLTVSSPPKWTFQPEDITVTAGQEVTLRCEGTGYPNPTMTWTRQLPPKIPPFSFPKNLLVGERITVSCTISAGDMPVQFAWLKDGSAVNQATEIRIIENREYSTLKIESLTESSGGNYTCTATNNAGYTSYTALLAVQAPPTWLHVPEDSTYVSGSNSTMICSAKGFPPPKVTWSKTDVGTSNRELKPTGDESPGISTIAIHNVGRSHQGQYTCTASNGVGNELSKTVNLKVKSPKIQAFSFPATLTVGESAATLCAVTAGDRPYTFTWLKDGRKLEPHSKVKISQSDLSSAINLESLSISHSGNYTCVVKNSVGTASYVATLTVNSPPNWIQAPVDTTVVTDTSATLACHVSGFPAPKVQWFRTEETQDVPLEDDNGTITFHRAHKGHQGRYKCVATNSVGVPLSKIVQFTVKKPRVQPTNNTGAQVRTCRHNSGTCPVERAYWCFEPGKRIKWFPAPNAPSTTRYDLSFRTHPTGVIGALIRIMLLFDLTLFVVVLLETLNLSAGLEAPKIQPFAFNAKTRVGERAAANCALLTEASSVTFVWLKNNVKLDEREGLSIKTNELVSLLVIQKVDVADDANYTCKATNVLGSDSYTARLSVEAPPTWASEPQDVAALQGGNVSLVCKAKGSPAPSITWTKNSESGTDIYTRSSGSLLVVENAHEKHEGLYTCTAENGVGSSIRKTVRLTCGITLCERGVAQANWIELSCARRMGNAQGSSKWTLFSSLVVFYCAAMSGKSSASEMPKVLQFQFPNSLTVGQSVSVTCTVKEGSKPLELRWLKDGHDIRESGNRKLTRQESFTVLFIESLRVNDSGNFTCVAKNKHGYDRYTAVLEVHAPPKWIAEPTDITVTSNTAAKLYCAASGSPQPTIAWIRKAVGTNAEQTPIKVHANGTSLMIHQTTARDSGQYTCTASNGVGKPLVKTVTLTVKMPAKFTEKHITVTARRGENARLVCDAQGDQPLTVSWSKGQAGSRIAIDRQGSNRLEIFETLTDSGLRSELFMTSTERSDGGVYTCEAENEFGRDERTNKLLVVEVPGQPQDVKMGETWSRAASVSWSPPYSGNSPVAKYVIQFWRDTGTAHRLQEVAVPGSQTSALVGDLHPGSHYQLNILAENSVGVGQPSTSVRFHTGEEEPSAPPTDINIEARGPSTVRISWKPPPPDEWNGELAGYYIGYKPTVSGQPYSYRTSEFKPNSTSEYFLTGLQRGTEYAVIVKAYNGAGSGVASHELHVKTLDGDVPTPPKVFVSGTSHGSITVTWHQQSQGGVRGFVLHYRSEEGVGQEWKEVSVDARTSSYTIGQLEAGSLYQVFVSATNEYGTGDPSEIITVRTHKLGGILQSPIFGNAGTPMYLNLFIMVPVLASVVTIVVVVIVTCICLQRIKRQPTQQHGIPHGTVDRRMTATALRHAEKGAMAAQGGHTMSGEYTGLSQRYVEVQPPPLPADHPCALYPAPYATLPMTEDVEAKIARHSVNQEMKTFLAQNRELPTLPIGSKGPMSTKKDHMYESPQ